MRTRDDKGRGSVRRKGHSRAGAGSPTAAKFEAQIDKLKRDRKALLELVSEVDRNRRRIEHARREWTQVLDAIVQPVFVRDGDFRIVRANRAYADQAGADVHDLIGRLYYRYFPRLDGPLPGCTETSASEGLCRERIELADGRVFVSRSYPIAAESDGQLRVLHVMEDITERERAEAQARTLGRAVEQAAEGMFIVDAGLTITYVNPALVQLTGYASEELVGQPLSVLRPGDVSPEPEAVREAIIATGRWSGEVDLLAADGTRIPVNLSAAALFDERDELTGFINSFLDLRPIKQAIHQVETLFESIEDLSLQLDVDMVAQKAMAAAARVCGADGAAVAVCDPQTGHLHYRWYIGFPQDERVESLRREFDIRQGIAGAVLRDNSTKIIDDYPAYEGALKSFVDVGVRSAMAVPIAAGGGPLGVLSLASLGRARAFDPAHVRFAEALARQLGVALQREQLLEDVGASSKRLAQIFETVPDVLFALRPADLGTELVSPAVTELLGYTPEELIAEPTRWQQLLHKEDRERVLAEIRRAVEQGDGLSVDVRMWHRDGRTLRWFEGRGVTERDAQGQPRTIIGAFTDITLRREDEAQLLRVNRALATLSRGNELLVRANDESTLFDQVCVNITGTGGYALAWVGLVEDDADQTLHPTAWAGRAVGYLDSDGARQHWGEAEYQAGPVATAIRSGEPVIVRNIVTDRRIAPWRARALDYGLCSMIVLPLRVDNAVSGMLAIYSSDTDAFDTAEQRLLSELADDLAFGLGSLRTRAERERVEGLYRDSLVGTIQAIARTVEKRDPYTAGHQQRVAQLAVVLANEMGLAPERIEGLRLGALIHDIGKIYIPAEILNRPGRLTSAEFEIIKTHSEVGYDIVKDVCFPWPVAQMILQHHERLDGSGYPQGLEDGHIILEARIMAVADVVEAITSHRPYRPAVGLERALEEIRAQRGTRYDGEVVDACLRLFEDQGFRLESLDAADDN